MSLQVWLPLNGNTENQGCSRTSGSLTNENITYQDGKIGKAIRISNYATTTATYEGITNVIVWSVSVWLKLSSSDPIPSYADFFMLGIDNDGATSNGFRIEHRNTSGTFQIITTKRTDYGSTTHSYWHFATSDTVAKDQWAHIVITNDGTYYRTYYNGVFATASSVSNFSPTTSKLTGSLRLGQRAAYCWLNDLRIYDHCLTEKEVKEISKGLVVHYPLSQNGVANYFRNSNFYTETVSYWGSVNSSSVSYAEKDGYKCLTGTKGTSNNICCQIIETSSYSYVANTNVTFTISADIYVEDTGTIGIGNWITTTEASGWQGMSFTEVWNTSNTLKIGWNHVSVTHVNAHNQYNGRIITAFAYTGTTFWLTNAKFEFSDKESKWIPNANDIIYTTLGFNSTTEYDTSGYKNNGTRNGTLESSSDTPRYSVSTNFPSSTYIRYKAPATMYHATYSFWVKFTQTTGYGSVHMQVSNPNGGDSPWFCVNTESSQVWAYFGNNEPRYVKGASGSLSTNTWYHCVFVWTNGVAQWYVNGAKNGSAVTFTSRTYITNSADSTIGDSYTGSSWAGCDFKGQVSDFRIYATALSDADILELYNIPISINKHSMITQGEYIEQ